MNWSLAGFLWLVVIGFGINSAVISQRASIAMSNLELADDASTPEQKATFLRAFAADMDGAKLPEHAAWIWSSERNRISNQRIVLDSLIARCDAITPLDKTSFGYAQGMTQLTGQEFDHVMGEVKAIYSTAYVMRYGWFMVWGWSLFIFLAIAATAFAFIQQEL